MDREKRQRQIDEAAKSLLDECVRCLDRSVGDEDARERELAYLLHEIRWELSGCYLDGRQDVMDAMLDSLH